LNIHYENEIESKLIVEHLKQLQIKSVNKQLQNKNKKQQKIESTTHNPQPKHEITNNTKNRTTNSHKPSTNIRTELQIKQNDQNLKPLKDQSKPYTKNNS